MTRGRFAREAQGFTLAEMMVTIMLMLAVLFALYAVFDMSIRVYSAGEAEVEAIENARLGLEKVEREIRAAYPVDAINGVRHVFFGAGSPATPASPARDSITFGNDLPQGATPPNRRIADTGNPTAAADPSEVITYALRHRNGGVCPATGTGGLCRLQRITSAGSAAVVDHVVPGGLRFSYLRSDLRPATAADGTDIGVVRIGLRVSVDGRSKTLTTDVDLRNRGG